MSERPAGRDRRRRRRQAQRGHLMAGLVAMVAIMMIFSTMAFQAWEDVLHRDNEAEMIFRAQDIVRAIQRYRRDHGGQGPQKLEDLMEPGPKGQYYLRKLYEDPLADDGKWGLLYAGPGGQIIDPNSQPEGAGLGLGQGTGGGLSGGLQQAGSSNQFGLNNQGQPGQPGQPGQQPGQFGQQGKQPGTGPNQPGSQISSAFAPEGSMAGGRVLAGLPIAGVRSLSDKKPFRIYKGFFSYSEWRFTYFDLEVGQPGQPGQQGGNQNQTGGSGNGGGAN